MCTNAAHITAIEMKFVANDNAALFSARAAVFVRAFVVSPVIYFTKMYFALPNMDFRFFFGSFFFRSQFRLDRFMMV